MHSGGARMKPCSLLKERGAQAQFPNRFESFFTERIGSDGADQYRVMAKPAGMRGKVQGRPAQPSRVFKNVPQHFAQDDDRTPVHANL